MGQSPNRGPTGDRTRQNRPADQPPPRYRTPSRYTPPPRDFRGVFIGLIAGLGLATALLIDHLYSPPKWQLFLMVGLPMPILAILFARHAKALYLAMDHWFDPHLKN